MKTRIPSKCIECGLVKYFLPSELRKNHGFCSIRCSKLGKHNGMYKEDVGYSALHQWVRTQMSEPNLCDNCNEPKRLDLANISGEYKRDLGDWEWLCRKCHMEKDGRKSNLLRGVSNLVKQNENTGRFERKN